jgi:hypothetical protein
LAVEGLGSPALTHQLEKAKGSNTSNVSIRVCSTSLFHIWASCTHHTRHPARYLTSNALRQHLSLYGQVIARLLLLAGEDSWPLASYIKEQPAAACQALELACRGLDVADLASADTSEDPAYDLCVIYQVLELWGNKCTVEQLQQLQLAPAMVSTAISCLKLAAKADSVDSARPATVFMLASAANRLASRLFVLQRDEQQAASAAGSNATSSSSGRGSSMALQSGEPGILNATAASSTSSNISGSSSAGTTAATAAAGATGAGYSRNSCQTTTGCSSSSSTTGLALLVYARSLRALGMGLAALSTAAANGAAAQTVTEADKEGDASNASDVSLNCVMWLCCASLGAIRKLLPSLQLPGAPGAEEACSAARQQLQQQSGQLLLQCAQQLRALLQLLTPGNPQTQAAADGAPMVTLYVYCTDCAMPVGVPCSMVPLLLSCGQQLVQFADAVCVQFPVAVCCNNPACSELYGLSEQQLVAGKACKCSCCRCVDRRVVGQGSWDRARQSMSDVCCVIHCQQLSACVHAWQWYVVVLGQMLLGQHAADHTADIAI